MYTELTIGKETYKLRLTTRSLVELEKTLGCNPIQMFMGIDNDVLPKLGDIIAILHQSLQALQHGISLDKTYDLMDEYLSDHTVWDIIPVFIDVFKDCGFMEKDSAEGESKN